MEEKESIIKKAIHGFKFTFMAQIIVLVLGIVKSIILPKVLSIPDYGYWQIYVLYSTYVGIFALGFNDGIYLLYGKYQYEELPFAKLRSATKFYMGMLGVFSILGCIITFLVNEEQRKIVLWGVCIDIILAGINGLLIYVLQITNQMKAYSFYSVLDKIFMLLAVFVISFLPGRNYKMVVMSDVLARVIVSIGLIIKCKEFFVGQKSTAKDGWKEFTTDIKVGINLMIANLMGMFVTGIGRFIVDMLGDISEYAYYSFGITVTNLILTFITAVSLVLYPALKRLPEKNYYTYYNKLNFSVGIFNNLALFLYFPAVLFVQVFLPQYSPMLGYLHFLFGVVILQAKMQLINNTFYKVLREEKALLKANMSCVILFLVISLITYSVIGQVWAIAVCTFVAMLYRCYASEFYLRKKMGVKVSQELWCEIAYIGIFIIVTTFFRLKYSLVAYVLLFGVYILINREKWKKININK